MTEAAHGLPPRLARAAPGALQIAGLMTVAYGFGMLAAWLGVVVAGLFLCVAGWAFDTPSRSTGRAPGAD